MLRKGSHAAWSRKEEEGNQLVQAHLQVLSQTEFKKEAPVSWSRSDHMSGESNFLEAMPENMEHVKQLQHLYTQLFGEMDTIGECIALYENHRAVLKELQEKKEEAVRAAYEGAWQEAGQAIGLRKSSHGSKGSQGS
jgi:hypothetical protein